MLAVIHLVTSSRALINWFFEKSGFKKVTKDKVVIRGDEGSMLNIEMDEETEFPIIPGQILFSDF